MVDLRQRRVSSFSSRSTALKGELGPLNLLQRSSRALAGLKGGRHRSRHGRSSLSKSATFPHQLKAEKLQKRKILLWKLPEPRPQVSGILVGLDRPVTCRATSTPLKTVQLRSSTRATSQASYGPTALSCICGLFRTCVPAKGFAQKLPTENPPFLTHSLHCDSQNRVPPQNQRSQKKSEF